MLCKFHNQNQTKLFFLAQTAHTDSRRKSQTTCLQLFCGITVYYIIEKTLLVKKTRKVSSKYSQAKKNMTQVSFKVQCVQFSDS